MRSEHDDDFATAETETGTASAPAEGSRDDTATPAATAEIVEEVVIEEVSIDGMCGVY